MVVRAADASLEGASLTSLTRTAHGYYGEKISSTEIGGNGAGGEGTSVRGMS